MNKFFKFSAIAIAIASTVACTRVETGEIGVRIGVDKQVQQGELMPGSFNQTLIGSIITFPVKDVAAEVDNMTPIAADNSTMADFDMTVIYNINPNSVAELYSQKSRSFHVEYNGDTYLMFNYIAQTARNSAYKAAREYEALTMNDKRQDMEAKIKASMQEMLNSEKLGDSITISQVQIRKIQPAQSIIDSANELVRAKNELAKKEVEVRTAEAESRRMNALSNQSAQSIKYMEAQAALNISEGIKNGKVQTIIVPSNFTSLMTSK